MRLLITTPVAVVADLDDVVHVRAEDESGAFGILPRHADFLTALAISVASWRDGDGREGHVAVRGGVFRVRDGHRVEIATREAVRGDELETLETEVLRRFRADAEREQRARTATARLELAALRHLRGFLSPGEGDHRTAPTVAAADDRDRRRTRR
ncbi:MAG: F0F1 ATP synthase subunit epsilon [Rhodospirillales bacterium]